MEVVSITEARSRKGLRLVTRRGVPTPWAQAAKGIIELKGLPCVLAQESEADPKGAHADWTGDAGAPFVAYDDEPLRSGWVQILELAERLAPHPRCVPQNSRERAALYGYANEICGEMGLGWCLRLLMVHASLVTPEQEGAFPERIAHYLGRKYGYRENCAPEARRRVLDILGSLSALLGEKPYFFGELTALDIYWAAFGNMFMLLEQKELPAAPLARNAWGRLGGGRFKSEVSGNLARHHRKMYTEHLSLSVQL